MRLPRRLAKARCSQKTHAGGGSFGYSSVTRPGRSRLCSRAGQLGHAIGAGVIVALLVLAPSAAAAATASAAATPTGAAAVGSAAQVSGVGQPAQATGPPVRLTLASQTPWVGPGEEFQLRVNVVPADTVNGMLSITVYSAVPNRSEFARTLANKVDQSPIGRPLAAPLATLAPDPAGARVVRLGVQDPAKPKDSSRLQLPRSGVYPVRVQYTPDDGSAPSVLVTHVLYLSGPITGDKLNVAWIVPVHVPANSAPDGTTTITADESSRLAQLAAAIDASRDLPLVLRPTPDTLAALASSSRAQDQATLATLARPVPTRQVVAGTYTPVPLAGLLLSGLSADATTQLTRGSDVLASTLSIRPDGRTWVETGPLDDRAAAFLRGAQVDRLVVADSSLSPNPLPVTLEQPFELAVRPGTHLVAVAADPGLASHFLDPDPVLAAHQLLADLAVLYLDRPGQTRGVVIDTPRLWSPDAAFLQSFIGGLTSSPVLAGATVDHLFATVPEAIVRGSGPLVRTLVADPRIGQDAGTFPVDALRSTRRRLEGFASSLASGSPLYDRLDHALLTAESADLTDAAQRQAQIDRVNKTINEQLGLIQLPSARTITLTAHTGRLPVTIRSGADYPLSVTLRVQSDKLSFPANGSTGSAAETIDLHRGDNSIEFTVLARTAGSFPLHITVLSRDLSLVLAARTFTVQSTALASVGLALSAGAALFLAIWWGRHALRGRKARRLVGGDGNPSGRGRRGGPGDAPHPPAKVGVP